MLWTVKSSTIRIGTVSTPLFDYHHDMDSEVIVSTPLFDYHHAMYSEVIDQSYRNFKYSTNQ